MPSPESSLPFAAFLGLGVMGGGMAGRLLDAGVPISVWNRNPDRAAALGRRGARVASSPREAAAGAGFVFSMVADDAASRAVWLGPDGALAGAAPGAVLVESGTVSPGWAETLAAEAAARQCSALDAPVTGSRSQAASGQLLFLVGGPTEPLERARPLFAMMGRDVLHVGPSGSGARLKLINNFVCGVQAAALAEALALVERTGLNREAALSVLTTGAPGSPLVGVVSARMMKPDYSVNFSLALMHKDLSYAIAEGERAGVPLSTAVRARELFTTALEAGLGNEDFAAVIEPLRQSASF